MLYPIKAVLGRMNGLHELFIVEGLMKDEDISPTDDTVPTKGYSY